MGVLNLTPDSFSDGGEFTTPEHARQHAQRLLAAGADILDIGGASSHPRASVVTPATELQRVAELVEQLAAQLPIPISIDTQTPSVARQCLQLGANIINDVSGFANSEMATIADEYQAPLVITYNNFHHPLPPEASMLEHMLDFFQTTIKKVQPDTQLILDPGYGFGKTPQQNLQILNYLPQLLRLGRPVLVCTSRKASLARLTIAAPPKERLGASIASALQAAQKGVHLLRVHDVFPHRQALLWQQQVENE